MGQDANQTVLILGDEFLKGRVIIIANTQHQSDIGVLYCEGLAGFADWLHQDRLADASIEW